MFMVGSKNHSEKSAKDHCTSKTNLKGAMRILMHQKFKYLVLSEARGEIEWSVTRVSRVADISSDEFSRAFESDFSGNQITFQRKKGIMFLRKTSSVKVRLLEEIVQLAVLINVMFGVCLAKTCHRTIFESL